MKPNHPMRRARLAATGCVLGLSLALVVPANAQVVVAEAGPSLIQHLLNQLNTYAQRFQDQSEYTQQAQRWYQTYTHYQQQIVRTTGYFAQMGMDLDRSMEPVPEDKNMERCGSGTFSLATLAGRFALDGAGNIRQQQQDICRRIQLINNRKYNATVRLMREVGPQIDAHIRELELRRNSSNDEGNVMGSANDVAQFDIRLKGHFSQWETQMKMYDSYIASLQESQKVLAHRALKGTNDTIGTLVRTATLQGALEVGN